MDTENPGNSWRPAPDPRPLPRPSGSLSAPAGVICIFTCNGKNFKSHQTKENSERNRVGPSGDALSTIGLHLRGDGSPAGQDRGPLAPLQGRMRASKEKESGWVLPFAANDRNPIDTALVSRKGECISSCN